ncbi:limbic system-associated membrane protein-like [Ptychodera flava]|uniref:limbic system-associated membrane protein-like n=1 Tax=Ptychodera flava TaxID=63121 RepID=UPI00396A1ACB
MVCPTFILSFIRNSRIDSKEKDTVVLSCHVDSNPYPSEFQWFYDDVLLSSQSKYTINDVTRDDAGNYTCTVTTVFYDDTSATDQGIVHLGVQYLSTVNITILPSRINEGDDVDIHCKASGGKPGPHKIELIFKDESLATNDSQELHHKITDISPGSSGSYQCRAFTNFYDGSEEYSVTQKELVVYYAARLIPGDDREFKAEIGEVVDINCTAHGMPVPSIKWFDANDREISDEGDNFEIRNHQPIGNVITSILSITLADSTYYGSLAKTEITESGEGGVTALSDNAEKTQYADLESTMDGLYMKLQKQSEERIGSGAKDYSDNPENGVYANVENMPGKF